MSTATESKHTRGIMTATEVRERALECADEVIRVLRECKELGNATFSRSLIADPITVAIREAVKLAKGEL
jgi:hypothetical protein